MKKLLYIFGILAIATACLTNDILDKDLDDTNFQESDFFLSGNFASGFKITYTTIRVDTIEGNSDPRCKPIYTLHLDPSYSQQLAENWSDQIKIMVYRGEQNPASEYTMKSSYNSTFETNFGSMDCNTSEITQKFRLELIDPITQRVSAAVDYKEMTLPTSL